VVFLVCSALAITLSLVESKAQPGAVDLGGIDFSTATSFNIAGIGVALILAALYASWW
jgi:solute:Na+ symporter, SSS family